MNHIKADISNIAHILEESIWGDKFDKEKNAFIDFLNQKTLSNTNGRIKTSTSYAPTGFAGKISPGGKKASLTASTLDGDVIVVLKIYSEGEWVIYTKDKPPDERTVF